MASIEFITKRIEGKKKEIEKLEKKLSRIEKARDTNWEVNPYYYNELDLKWTQKDLDAARVALSDYEKDLQTETEKANSRNVPAIIKFLDGWRARATAEYREALTEYHNERSRIRGLYKEMEGTRYGTPEREAKEKEIEQAQDALHCKLNGYFHKETYTTPKGHIVTKKVKDRDGELEFIERYTWYTFEEAMQKIESELKQEANRKYDFIIERTNAAVGEIKDASGLYIGSTRGELNGYIIGERGKVEVETIMAGGYNIQCLHLRVLIKKVK